MLLVRQLSTPVTLFVRNYQVTVLGAASEIGQTICLLLRAHPSITKLVIHDNSPDTAGIHLDLSHIPDESEITGFFGANTLEKALHKSDLIIAAGGVLARPGWSKKKSFASNAAFIKQIAVKIAKTVPMPFVGIVTEPINSMVPMAAEVMRNHGDCDGKKVLGITTIDLLRAQCLYGMKNGLKPQECFVPVIGGHSKETVIPLLSQATPYHEMNEKQIRDFTSKIQDGDEIVTNAKKGFSPTLSVAYGVLIFVSGILRALEGHPSKVTAYVENNDFGTSFFSGLVNVTPEGVGGMKSYSNLSKYECYLLEQTIAQLRKDISEGRKVLEFACSE